MLSPDNISAVMAQNASRRAAMQASYNAFTGEGCCGRRFAMPSPIDAKDTWHVPLCLQQSPFVQKYLRSTPDARMRKIMVLLRLRYDFEYWSVLCNTIADAAGNLRRLTLNRAQRRIHGIAQDLQAQRKPLRINLLKCRQYGATTYIRSRFNHIQTTSGTRINSATAADIEAQADHAIAMFNVFVDNYPSEMGKITTGMYARSSKILQIKETGGILATGSMIAPKTLSGKTFQLLHCTEVGKWQDSSKLRADKFMLNLNSTVPYAIGTEIWREGTAYGLGFFFNEWNAAHNSKDGYHNIFVPAWEVERYQNPIEDYAAFITHYIGTLPDAKQNYANYLWNMGATLENIKWYFDYMHGSNIDWYSMMQEYPNSADEAFQTSGARVFEKLHVQQLRMGVDPSLGGVCEPSFIGDIEGSHHKGSEALSNIMLVPAAVKPLAHNAYNQLLIWEMPPKDAQVSNRFIVTVDIGGTWVGDRNERCSDYSVIGVFDRYWTQYGLALRCTATWRGHIDVDLLAWKAAQISKLWHDAMLVVERNDLKHKGEEGSDILTILREIKDYYDNIYCEGQEENIREGLPIKYGFFTTKSNKRDMINLMRSMLRDGLYLERYCLAADEMDSFEKKANGRYEAMDGKKDDILITRLMACLIHERMPPCQTLAKRRELYLAPAPSPARGTAAGI
jgi:hypothetical protein